MLFTFTKKCSKDSYDYIDVEMSTTAVGKDVLCEMFLDFLKACGYGIESGDSIEIVNEKEYYEQLK